MRINLSRILKTGYGRLIYEKNLVTGSIFIGLLQITYAQPAGRVSSFSDNGIVKTKFGRGDKTDIQFVQQVLQENNNSYVRFSGNYITKRSLNG
jgi:hypothetical protein